MRPAASIPRRRASARLVGTTFALLIPAVAAPARATSLADLTGTEAMNGLKTALDTGARAAIAQLGRPDGFLGNPAVRIPLPGALQDAAKLLRGIGQGRRLDELETAMNRAAEQAIPLAGKLVSDAVRSLTVADAKAILTGGDTSVTDFFAGRTREPLTQAFLPTVRRATANVGVAEKYNRIAQRGASLGLVRPEDASIDQHVTRKALDGLYRVIGEEERKLRRDPLGSGSAILGRVFGALR